MQAADGLSEMFGPEMFGHLVGNSEVWVIEFELSGTTRYFKEQTADAAIWTCKLGLAKTFVKREQVEEQWTKIGNRGKLEKHKLAKIMKSKVK